MKKNMGKLDSIVRLTVAVLLAYLLFAGTIAGVWAIVSGIAAAIMLFTAIFRVCPLFTLVGITTICKKDQAS